MVDQPRDRQRLGRGRLADARARRRRPRRRRRRTRTRPGSTVFGLAPGGDGQPRVGGVGQRRRRPRARLPRHVPRGRVLPPGRQHPADPRRRPARRPHAAATWSAASRPATRSRSTWSGRSACTSTRSTTSRTSARRRPPASARCSACAPRRSSRRSARPCTPRPPRGSRRKGEISTWKAHAPAFAGKVADRGRGPRDARPDLARRPSTRARTASSPGCWTGPTPPTTCRCPRPARPSAAILDTYTKEHSAEYQAQALIDLARALGHERPDLRDPANVAAIVLHTSHHTHHVIGSGANDPQKYDPTASRETLDHSIPYIFTVALQDGGWHHVRLLRPGARRSAPTRSSCGARSPRPRTPSGPAATTRPTRPRRRSAAASRSRSPTAGRCPAEIAVADAHPLGARPFAREQYVGEVPHAGRGRPGGRRDRAVPRPRRSACPS